MSNLDLQKTGTTTLAIKCKNGVIIGADKRATAGHEVVQRDAKKLHQLKDNVVIAWAGVVSEIQNVVKIISAEIRIRELKTGRPMLVKEIASLLGNMAYGRIRTPSTVMPIAAFTVAGYDAIGPQVYSVSPDGVTNEESTFVADGSGGTYAISVLEDSYKEDMKVDDAVGLAKRAFNVALLRDTASGNGFKAYSITEKGSEVIADEAVNTGIKQ
ncbi:MAG: hypothetical protein ACQER9_02220 [Nanobdellota archaeon]